MKLGILLLAAGRARRFGSDKRRALLADGRSLLQHSLDRLGETGLPLYVCLGPEDEPRALLPPGVASVICPGAEEGMGQTLAEGVARIPAEWEGLLVALADLPGVTPASVLAVARALRPGGIVMPVYRGQRGHPVAFHQDWFPALRGLTGDTGARQVLRSAGAAVCELPLDDPGLVRDVDRPRDLAALFNPAGAGPG